GCWGRGGPALPVLEGHPCRVLGALRLVVGRLLSWSSDRTLRLWGSDGTALTPLEAWIYSSDDREKIYTWARKHGFDANEIFEGNPGAELGRIDKYGQQLQLYHPTTGQTLACFIGDAIFWSRTVLSETQTIAAGDDAGRVIFLKVVPPED